ncbi:MAG: PQQ-dependent sugar dehydrogenase [Cytophagaceae bacterium]|jgi:glucose/arabinose dehydrogenase|nr:PQQ-dependent sugar dehydrogenase [Cytophagaceae bacterium]
MKNTKHFLILAGALLLSLSCKKSDDAAQPGGISFDGPPVETNPANTTYSPAFAGQTRVNGATTNTEYESTVLTSSLTSPWGIAVLPNGKLLITEKGGIMRLVTASGTVTSVYGIPDVNAGGQGGLLGLCLDPQFSTNRMVYWVFSEDVSGGTVTAVAKGKLSTDEASIEDATVIFRATPAFNGDLHYGGRILFDASGNLYVSTGERSDLSTRPLAQSVSGALGKVLRITKDGAAAPGNPSFTGTNPIPELYSIGHRNPQGLAIHPTTGDLWQGEHGPRGGDEINRIQAGANYGWPTITYGIEYDGDPIGAPIQQKTGMEQPVYYWDPVISPSGMTFYKTDSIPEWQNNLFVCALSGKHIARLVIDNNRVVGEERLLATENQRFRDITQSLSNGALYAVTDGGKLYRIKRK